MNRITQAPRILLLGADGQVGWELRRALLPLGEVRAMNRAQADLTDLDGLRALLQQERPEFIVNAAAYTSVDKAESESDLARRINADAPQVLADHAAQTGAWLLHYSTDYVFYGTKPAPYTEGDAPNPQSVYGQSKLAGEQAIATADYPLPAPRTANSRLDCTRLQTTFDLYLPPWQTQVQRLIDELPL